MFIRPYWPWFILLAVIALILEFLPAFQDRWRHQRAFQRSSSFRSDQDQLQWLRGMTPKQFEDYVAQLYRELGYSTEAVGRSHDEGIDVIAVKNGRTHYIQCKKYVGSVPAGAVRDFYGAIASRGADSKGIFVTTGVFSTEAEQFAQDKPLELIDGQALIRLIHSVPK